MTEALDLGRKEGRKKREPGTGRIAKCYKSRNVYFACKVKSGWTKTNIQDTTFSYDELLQR
jgi:uncharacterized protein Veg